MIAILLVVTVLLSPVAKAQKSGGTVTGPIITSSFIKNFNPFTQFENSGPARGFMYEPLLFHNNQQNRIEYRLATAFQYADDLTSITFTLREAVKWSDGKPFTAADVVFSHRLARDNPQLDSYGLWQGTVPKLKSVEAIDDRQVRFHLSVVDITVHDLISKHPVVPKHTWATLDDPVNYKNEEPVGSGPLTVVKNFKPQQMIVCRNPFYWEAGKPLVDCLKLRQFQSNDQVQAALIRNELDWGANFIADIEKTFVARDPQNNHFWYPPNTTVSIHLNTTRKPFDDLRFRQAFSHAINRAEIVDFATYGYANLDPHVTGIGDYFKQWYSDPVNQKYDHLGQYDPARAKALLDEAGYKDLDADGFRENPDGTPLKFEIQVVNGWSDWVQAVQLVVDYLKDVGVEARTRAVEFGQYSDNFLGQEFQSGILWGDVGATPYLFYKTLLNSSLKGVTLQANHGFYDPEIDALLDEFTREEDADRQQQIIARLQEFVAGNLMVIPIFSNPTWYQYSTRRFLGWPTAENPYVNPDFYNAGARTMLINHLYPR